jgi:hypothetical protein
MNDRHENEKLTLERIKLEIDSVEHVTTLATGTILLIALYLEKATPRGHLRSWLGASIGLLFLCLTACFVFIWGRGIKLNPDEKPFRMLSAVIYFSFCLGMGALATSAFVLFSK